VECYKDNALSYTAEVSSYVISNGLYIPKELKSVICQSTDSSKKPTVITVYRYVTVKSINQVIPSEAFEITIPQWARVQDENTKKYYIWGKGKPYLTFDSVEAARQWEYEMNNKRYLWIPITAFVLIVLVPLIILFVYLKRHAKVSPPSK
jgi:lipopolysaccharide export LptBFGC system permease protein LptF